MPRQVSTPRTSEDGKLLLEVTGARVPKGYEPVHGKHSDANKFETTMGREGHIFMASLDGQNDTLGVTDDAESASGNGTVVAILKRIRTLLGQVVLAAGTAIIGKVGIDQTTDGTTNRVVAKISQTAGENVVAVTSSALPTGASTLAKQDTIIGHVDGIETLIGTTNTNIGTTNTNIGATTDAESTTGNGTFIALLKRVRTLLTAVFEAVITLGQAIGTAKAILVAGSDGTNLRAISTTNTGAVNTVLAGSNVQDVTFHNGATVVASGTVLTVGGYKILTVEVSGTSTSRNIEFMARGPAGINRPIMGIRLNDLATSASTNSTGEIWQFDISGLSSVLMNLADVVGGNVTVQGKVMA